MNQLYVHKTIFEKKISYIHKKNELRKRNCRICIWIFSNHMYDDSIHMMNRDTILYAMIILLFLLHIYEKNDEQYF
jgi:hypothetical protein